jgi:hypothetical protein
MQKIIKELREIPIVIPHHSPTTLHQITTAKILYWFLERQNQKNTVKSALTILQSFLRRNR